MLTQVSLEAVGRINKAFNSQSTHPWVSDHIQISIQSIYFLSHNQSLFISFQFLDQIHSHPPLPKNDIWGEDYADTPVATRLLPICYSDYC